MGPPAARLVCWSSTARMSWVGNWNGRPFANTLFLRNPGMKQKHLMEYREIVKQDDGSERLIEAGPAAASRRDRGIPPRLHRLRPCRSTSTDTEEVWAAAFRPTTAAFRFLVERLTEVLDPNLKNGRSAERRASRHGLDGQPAPLLPRRRRCVAAREGTGADGAAAPALPAASARNSAPSAHLLDVSAGTRARESCSSCS